MKTDLFTGMHLLSDESGSRSLGMVGAFGSASRDGTVRVTLDTRYFVWQLGEDSLTMELPERLACRLAENLQTVTGQLAHLRALLRLGLLTQEAIYDPLEIDSLEGVPRAEDCGSDPPSSAP